MKSLLLSDFYNVSTIGKRLLLAVSIISISFLIGFGGGNFLTYTTCMCGMMVVNLFSMDERSNWIKYAMIMPTQWGGYNLPLKYYRILWPLLRVMDTVVNRTHKLIRKLL